MKKVAYCIIIFATIFMITTPVQAETVFEAIPKIVTVEPISSIEDIISTEGWDNLVIRCQVTQIDRTKEVLSTDQIVWLVKTLEKDRIQAIEEYRNIMWPGSGSGIGVGIWEKEAQQMTEVEVAFKKVASDFEAKTGVKLLIKKGREVPEDGYICFNFYTKETPYYQTHQVQSLGEFGYAQRNLDMGNYYESPSGGGSGKSAHIENRYVSYNQRVQVVGVAYLDEHNEVVEVGFEEGIHISQSRKRMLLIKTEKTLLGWTAPENVVTD